MRKTVLVLTTGGLVLYMVALISTLYIAKRPVFETVVPKSSTGAMVLDKPVDARIDPSAAVDLTVLGSEDEVVGRLAGVTEGTDGRAKSILVETGGFLGLGSRTVRISANDFSVGDDAIRVVYSARELEQLPEAENAR